MKQSITTSRTFATAIDDRTVLEEQVANFCAHCARQLRVQHSVAQQMLVYAHTSSFRTDIEQHYLSEVVTLPVATSNTQELVNYALAAFSLINPCWFFAAVNLKRRGNPDHIVMRRALVALSVIHLLFSVPKILVII